MLNLKNILLLTLVSACLLATCAQAQEDESISEDESVIDTSDQPFDFQGAFVIIEDDDEDEDVDYGPEGELSDMILERAEQRQYCDSLQQAEQTDDIKQEFKVCVSELKEMDENVKEMFDQVIKPPEGWFHHLFS